MLPLLNQREGGSSRWWTLCHRAGVVNHPVWTDELRSAQSLPRMGCAGRGLGTKPRE